MTLPQTDAKWLTRATETYNFIESNFWRNDHYIQSPAEPHPAYMWDLGMQLSALAALTKIDKKYAKEFDRCLKNINLYWSPQGPTPGYDVKPNPQNIDRYYDDNAWVALALLEQYENTKGKTYLNQAIKTHEYVMSGWDNQLGGGIYWKEREKHSKNTCSNAPSALTALRIYQLTKDHKYLTQGKQLLIWLDKNLRDNDGLYFDNLNITGKVERTKWSYNTALPIQAHLLLFNLEKDNANKAAAEQSINSAIKHWIGDRGEINDDAGFAVHLVDALLAFDDPKYTLIAERAAQYTYQKTRIQSGQFANRWDQSNPEKPGNLLAQSSAVRAFSLLAGQGKNYSRLLHHLE